MSKTNEGYIRFKINWDTVILIKKIASLNSLSQKEKSALHRQILQDVKEIFYYATDNNDKEAIVNLFLILLNYTNILFEIDAKSESFSKNNPSYFYIELLRKNLIKETDLFEIFDMVTKKKHCEYFYISFVSYLYERCLLENEFEAFANILNGAQKSIAKALYMLCYYYNTKEVHNAYHLKTIIKFCNIQENTHTKLPQSFFRIQNLFKDIYKNYSPRWEGNAFASYYERVFSMSDEASQEYVKNMKIHDYINHRIEIESLSTNKTKELIPIEQLISNAVKK